MVACVESTLKKKKDKALKSLKVAVFGATGVVGFSAGVIAALEGADVTLVGYDGVKRVAASGEEIKKRFKVEVRAADGSDDGKKRDIMADAEAVFSAGRAGVQVLSKDQVAAAKHLLIAADVNAVPPPGIEGLEAKMNGDPLGPSGAMGIGALTIGNVKYKTEFGLFKKMVEATKAVRFDFRDAFALAREIAQ
jgi:methylene-tetrahydromethanopterin dehydrogenase